MRLSPPACDNINYVHIDFDSDRLTQRVNTKDLSSAEAAAFDMGWAGCITQVLETERGRSAGLLPKDADATLSSCRAAASGGGLEQVSIDSQRDMADKGLVPGAAICVITDQKRVAMAKIDKVTWATNPTIDFSVTTWG
ncbi:hypothetical protein OG871_01960 [Kitasatospora sp. NBC_00374]|uniref:hypothetical protein n=1 Tax=Kitasatospora sp. NBC_00374 TaxID=2975964 RepID=UPI0030E222B7